MKTRHLVLGLGIVLALSLSVPALGGPLNLRSSGIASLKVQVKKALSTASAAQGLASAAQSTATGAQGAASGAQATAAAAKTAANGAQSTANGAQSTANGALTKANETASKLTGVDTTARNALTLAEGKVSHTTQVSELGAGGNTKSGNAQCPAGTFVSGGGFVIGQGLATPVVSEPEGNGWVAEAAANNSNFILKVWAMCLQK